MSERSTKSFPKLIKRLEAVPEGLRGLRLLEYFEKSEHQGWNGWTSRDLTGIRRFLEDFLLYTENYFDPTGEENV